MVGEACFRRGGVAGAEPPHKGGRLRPTAQNCSSQWSVIGGQRRRAPFIAGHELTMVEYSQIDEMDGLIWRDMEI